MCPGFVLMALECSQCHCLRLELLLVHEAVVVEGFRSFAASSRRSVFSGEPAGFSGRSPTASPRNFCFKGHDMYSIFSGSRSHSGIAGNAALFSGVNLDNASKQHDLSTASNTLLDFPYFMSTSCLKNLRSRDTMADDILGPNGYEYTHV